MATIFISHSSANNPQASALAEWLTESGWDDYFLDTSPTEGLKPGERWQESLKHAADRCEVVVFLLSPAWRDSRWCLAEFLLAKQLGKKIFGVVVETVALDTLPAELTAEWQLCDLVSGAERRTFQVPVEPGGQPPRFLQCRWPRAAQTRPAEGRPRSIHLSLATTAGPGARPLSRPQSS